MYTGSKKFKLEPKPTLGSSDIGAFDDGTAARPSITFNADNDTGFYRVAANELGITCGGVQAANFTTSGNYFTSGLQAPLYAFTGDDDTYLQNPSPNEVQVICGGSDSGTFTTTNLTLPGTLTADDVVSGSRVTFKRGNTSHTTTYASSERLLGLNGSYIFSSAISYANATISANTALHADAPFKFIRAPTSLIADVVVFFSASPTDFTVRIRKVTDGVSVEAITTTTSVGGMFTLTFDHTLFAANTWYYVTWSQSGSANASLALNFDVLL